MEFRIKLRDGPSRVGELLIDNKNVITPNILFINTDRFTAPNFADILIENNKRREDKPLLQISKEFFYPKDLSKELHLLNIKPKKNYCILPGEKDIIDEALKNNPALIFIVTNALQIFQQPKNFVEYITKLREKIGYEKIIYFPGIGDPTNLALLVYLGIDLFDSISSIIAARNDILFFSNGKYKKNELFEIPCSCPSCSKFEAKPSDMNFQYILNHNYFTITNEIKHIRNAINRGDLLGLVETRVKTEPILTAILRNLNANYYNYLEKRTPITSKSMLLATTKESLFRPEIIRFQKRIIKRYEKPESAEVLLLLPCSAKKPYSFSKSHKLFGDKLKSSGNPSIVHELIITSPIGIVPRELELVYPVSSYDIPVTGLWDEDEKKMIRGLLIKYLKINKYEKIIAHLPSEIMEFIEDILENPEISCINNPTSKESLDKLLEVLKKNVNCYDKVKSQIRLREDIHGLASYQFGKKIADKLLKDCIIKGKYPYRKIMKNNIQLGMITKERGLISLTMNGAERIAKSKNYWVNIYDDFTLKGSVFTPGIKDADDKIRIGDEVIVLQKDKLCAVGVAQMSGDEMKKSSHGEAVKVRHKL